MIDSDVAYKYVFQCIRKVEGLLMELTFLMLEMEYSGFGG